MVPLERLESLASASGERRKGPEACPFIVTYFPFAFYSKGEFQRVSPFARLREEDRAENARNHKTQGRFSSSQLNIPQMACSASASSTLFSPIPQVTFKLIYASTSAGA